MSQPSAGTDARGRGLKRFRERQMVPYLFLVPSGILIFGLGLVPFVQVITLGFFTRSTLGGDQRFVGLQNYQRLLADPNFGEVVWNSAVWTVGGVVLQMAVGLGVALLLHQTFFGRAIARGIVLFPYLIPTIVAVLVWRFMFHDSLGIVNVLLKGLGVVGQPVQWLGSPNTALWAAIVVASWKLFPFVVIALLAILQSIPTERYEAARVDGANTFQEFWFITLPAILPVFILTGLLRTIWTFDKFDIIYLLTGGGPLNSTTTMPVFIYLQAFVNWDIGRASAVATVMMLIMAVTAGLYLVAYRRAEGR